MSGAMDKEDHLTRLALMNAFTSTTANLLELMDATLTGLMQLAYPQTMIFVARR